MAIQESLHAEKGELQSDSQSSYKIVPSLRVQKDDEDEC